MDVYVVGAGLAGSECALQLAQYGFSVHLYEMKLANIFSPAHKIPDFAELICSNSLGSTSEFSPAGELKIEAQMMNSYILKAAQLSQVPAGQALGVDRILLSQKITNWITQHPNITIHKELVEDIEDLPRPLVIATGPLTHDKLAYSIQNHFKNIYHHDFLYFFDAIAPIISADSIDTSIAWRADRYDKGDADYLNCPMSKEQYFKFITAIKNARKIEPKDFEITPFFEGCMPIEAMLARGDQTLRFGPMKPVGLTDPRTGKPPYAIVQLRQENKEGTAYNIVGFQTRMAYGDQKEVFKMIPGLENAEFLKLGSMHRNLFINTPLLLNKDLSSKNDDELYFAGQITGVEGYFESTTMGLLVAHFIQFKFGHKTKNKKLALNNIDLNNFLFETNLKYPPRESAIGSLLNSITDEHKINHFQPTNINMGSFPILEEEKIKPILSDTLENSSISDNNLKTEDKSLNSSHKKYKNRNRTRELDKAEKKKQQIRNANKAFTNWLVHKNGSTSNLDLYGEQFKEL